MIQIPTWDYHSLKHSRKQVLDLNCLIGVGWLFCFSEMLVHGFKFPPWTTVAWSTPESKLCERESKSSYLPNPDYKEERVNDLTLRVKLKRAYLSYQIRFLPPVPHLCFEVAKGTIFPLVPFPVLSSPLKLRVLDAGNCLLGCAFYALITKETQTRQRRFKEDWKPKVCKCNDYIFWGSQHKPYFADLGMLK